MTYGDAIEALADPRRRAIFESLRSTPQTVAELAAAQPVSRPAVSQHLKILAEAGLVDVVPHGTRRIYSVRTDGLLELRQWIDGFWDEILDRFAAEVVKSKGEGDDTTGNEDD